MVIKKTSILSLLFYISVFMPYLRITPLNSDTQPGAVLLSLIVIFLALSIRKEKIPFFVMPLLVVSLVSILILLMDGFSINGLRSTFGYISLPIITYGSYLILKKDGSINISILKTIIWIWITVGIIQSAYNPYFLSSIISEIRTSSTRGVTSLAVEPTYFGQMMYFLLFFVLVFFKNNKEKMKYAFLCIFAIFVLARSSMIVLILIITLIIFIMNRIINKWGPKTFKYGAIILFALILVALTINMLPESSRLVLTMESIVDNGIVNFFYRDASSNFRLSSIYISIKGAFENLFIPRGFHAWPEYEILQKSQSTFFLYGQTNRIMSMYGSILFELGFFGAIIIILINKWLFKFLKKFRYPILIFLLYINFIFFTAVPLATPFVGFLLGTLLYYINCKTQV